MNMLTYAIMPEPFGLKGASKGGGGLDFSPPSNPVSDALTGLPFYVDLKPWMDGGATPKKFSQTIDKTKKEWKSPWLNHRRRLGEHLRWFHQATHIPVVSQADRSCTWSWINLNRGFENATDYLTALMRANEVLSQEDGGYLVTRNFRYWRHRRNEAPESIWGQFEPKDDSKVMAFPDYVRAARAFREDQIHSQEIGYPLSSIDTSAQRDSYDSLRLFANLAPDQQANAMKDGILIGDLGTDQQKQMVDTVIKLILDSGTPSLELSKALVSKGMGSQQFQALRFRVRQTEFSDQNHYTDELKDGDHVIEPRGTKRYSASYFEFTYSVSKDETVSQAIQFRK